MVSLNIFMLKSCLQCNQMRLSVTTIADKIDSVDCGDDDSGDEEDEEVSDVYLPFLNMYVDKKSIGMNSGAWEERATEVEEERGAEGMGDEEEDEQEQKDEEYDEDEDEDDDEDEEVGTESTLEKSVSERDKRLVYRTIKRIGHDCIFPPLDGTAFYSLICKINHSCNPNVYVKYASLPEIGEMIAVCIVFLFNCKNFMTNLHHSLRRVSSRDAHH